MHEAASAIRSSGVVGIVRTKTPDEAERAAAALLRGGLTAVEISLVTPDAIGAISRTAALGLGFVGAGTVLDAASAAAAARAGATFLVSPTVSRSVVAAGRRYGLATLPGVATPTEALKALELGADFVKLFPASAYGPAAVKDMLTALPQVPLVPTGGVTLTDAVDYIRAGSVAVGVGSALSTGTSDEVGERVQTLLRQLATARGER